MKQWMSQHRTTIVTLLVVLALAAGAFFARSWWLPSMRDMLTRLPEETTDAAADHVHDQSDVGFLELSPTARRNIGLTTGTVATSDYARTISVPAVVVQRPGRSQIDVTAPMTGVVTEIFAIEGQAIKPGQPLFELRLTHEDVVTAQGEFLTVLQQLEVIEKELARLRSIGEEVVPRRRILEKEYERDIAQAKLKAMRQALVLHGLSQQHIQQMEMDGEVIPSITVAAPPFPKESTHAPSPHLYHVQQSQVNRGQSVETGDRLAMLADHCELYVEGHTFEDDAGRLVQAVERGERLTVKPMMTSDDDDASLQLEVIYVADHVDQQSRALKFYLRLPNELQRGEQFQQNRFVAWKYRPGQRMEVLVPTGERWSDQLVLPPESVVIDGPNAFVFEQNGTHFDRVEVQVLYRDKNAVVVANDGKLIGSTIALSGAYDMQLALKNLAGGGVEAHHGHTH